VGESVLADTSALLAVLDTSQDRHEQCAATFRDLPLPLIVSHAVLTELFHLAGVRRRPQIWRFLRTGALRLAEIAQAELPRLDTLMEQYADRPMDFADATLVHLAEREGLRTVFTLDDNDFETYRIGARKRFRIVPGR
jgi:predicted nucleic acid-binding protein